MIAALEDSISKNLEIFMRLKLPDTTNYKEIRFQPYLFGKDPLGFNFIWGYLPENRLFHKVLVNMIEEIEVISILFTPFQNAKYLTPSGEKHYCVLKGDWKYR